MISRLKLGYFCVEMESLSYLTNYILDPTCGVKPFHLHGYGMDICVSNGPCFRRSSEVELHPYSVEGEMVFPVVCERLGRVLRSKLIMKTYKYSS